MEITSTGREGGGSMIKTGEFPATKIKNEINNDAAKHLFLHSSVIPHRKQL